MNANYTNVNVCFIFLFPIEFVQDVASRGLGLVYELSSEGQGDLADSLLNQLLGGKRQVNQVTEDTKLFEEGVLGKTPTGYIFFSLPIQPCTKLDIYIYTYLI